MEAYNDRISYPMIELQKFLRAGAAQNTSDLPAAGRCKAGFLRNKA